MIILKLLVIFIGLFIRYKAIKELGNNIHWRIVCPYKIINTGIYKYIRHPMYTGGLIDYTGFCWLVTGSFGVAVAFFALLINFTLDRIDREEKELCMFYGKEYIEYAKKTKMLIPFIF